MFGYYVILLCLIVKLLLFDCEVYIIDWYNVCDIFVSEGKFDVEDYMFYLVDFMKEFGLDIYVIVVC